MNQTQISAWRTLICALQLKVLQRCAFENVIFFQQMNTIWDKILANFSHSWMVFSVFGVCFWNKTHHGWRNSSNLRFIVQTLQAKRGSQSKTVTVRPLGKSTQELLRSSTGTVPVTSSWSLSTLAQLLLFFAWAPQVTPPAEQVLIRSAQRVGVTAGRHAPPPASPWRLLVRRQH